MRLQAYIVCVLMSHDRANAYICWTLRVWSASKSHSETSSLHWKLKVRNKKARNAHDQDIAALAIVIAHLPHGLHDIHCIGSVLSQARVDLRDQTSSPGLRSCLSTLHRMPHEVIGATTVVMQGQINIWSWLSQSNSL